MRFSLIATVLAVGSLSSPANATIIEATWQGGPGDWTDPLWTFSAAPSAASFPDNDGVDFFNVRIDNAPGTASPVILGQTVDIDSLHLDSDDSLSVGNASFVVRQDGARPASGMIRNEGLIDLQSTSGGTGELVVTGTATLQGAGEVRLGGDVDFVVFDPDQDPDSLRTRSTIRGSGALVNQDNRISGSGIVNLDFQNLAGGVVDADRADSALVLLAGTNTHMNLGTYEASDGGILRLFLGTYDQDDGSGDSGTIQALAGSTVHIEHSAVTIEGGALRTVDNGQLLIRGSSVDLDDTAFDNVGTTRIETADVDVSGNTFSNSGTTTVDNADLSFENVIIDNSGLIDVQATGGSQAALRVVNGSTAMLQGGGEVRLGGDVDFVVFDPDQDPDTQRARNQIAGGGLLVNQDNRISGSGIVNLDFQNLAGGVVDADRADSALVLLAGTNTHMNLGTYEASDGGILRLFLGTYDQDDGSGDSGTIQALADSTVHIENSAVTIEGGGLRTVDNGQLLIRGSSVTANDAVVETEGSVVVDGALFTVNGSYTQTGGETVLDGGTLSATTLELQDGALRGNGTIIGTSSIAGTASAGFSTGILDFIGDTTFSGNLEVELAGTAVDGLSFDPGSVNLGNNPDTTDFDQYNVFGTAMLSDGLVFDLDFIDGFVPMLGDFFDILTADLLIADLASQVFTVSNLAPQYSLAYSIVGFDDRQALRVSVAAASVPEPAALSLLAVGLLMTLGLAHGHPRVRSRVS